MDVWKFIAALQQKLEELYTQVRDLQEEIRTLRQDVDHNGNIFVKLQTICDDVRSESEEISQ